VHTPVLLNEVLTLFENTKRGVFVDCTLGFGGHAKALLERLPTIEYVGIDRDQSAIDITSDRLKAFGDRFRAVRGRFGEVLSSLAREPIVGILADLGVSSAQLDNGDRGFGFCSAKLDMRMNPSDTLNAHDVINGYSIETLTDIFHRYGEESRAEEMARLIAAHRPIKSAKELSDLITRYFSRGRIHPATKLFQAVRIEVNNELGELDNLLNAAEQFGARKLIVAIISFHSLEDRIVKNRFKSWSANCVCPPNAWKCVCGNNHSRGKILTKKPILPSERELKSNPRSRSAKLRGFEFYGTKT
jgi:16S rRNA (cytosine1402-N4)-methyltransferase